MREVFGCIPRSRRLARGDGVNSWIAITWHVVAIACLVLVIIASLRNDAHHEVMCLGFAIFAKISAIGAERK